MVSKYRPSFPLSRPPNFLLPGPRSLHRCLLRSPALSPAKGVRQGELGFCPVSLLLCYKVSKGESEAICIIPREALAHLTLPVLLL